MEYEIIHLSKEKWKGSIIPIKYKTDKFYEDHWENAYAWGVLVNNELVAAIETDQELWSNRLRITTADGKNFDAFMGIELAEEGMKGIKGIKGKFYESEVFENLPMEEVEKYNKKFPQLQKLRFPGQWD